MINPSNNDQSSQAELQNYLPQQLSSSSMSSQSDKSESKKRKQSTQNIKQQQKIAYEYYSNYYKQKMIPFYRAFNKQPYMKEGQDQNIKENKDNARKQFVQQKITSLQDFNKVQKQLYLRMLPVITGVKVFFEEILKKKGHIIGSVTIQGKKIISQLIHRKLQELQFHIAHFYSRMLNQGNKKILNQEKNQEFMQSDILISIHEFLKFLCENIPSELIFISESIFIIVIDIIICYYQNEKIIDFLKVHDISVILMQLPMIIQKIQGYNFVFLGSQQMIGLLIWFNSWVMIEQYKWNKFNLVYIREINIMMNQINSIYEKNVCNYVRYVKERKNIKIKKIKKIKKNRRNDQIIKKKMMKERQKDLEIKQKFISKQAFINKHNNYFDNHWTGNQNQSQAQNKFFKNKNYHHIYYAQEQSHNRSQDQISVISSGNLDKFHQQLQKQVQYWQERFQNVWKMINNHQDFKNTLQQRIQNQQKQIESLRVKNKNIINDPFIIQRNYRNKRRRQLSSSYENIQSYDGLSSMNRIQISKESKQNLQSI